MKYFCIPSILFVALLTGFGCASTTKILSEPSGATVVLDGDKVLGTTPIELREMVWIWTKHSLEFSMEGYVPRETELSGQFNGVNIALCLCGGGWLFPVLFAGGYPARVHVTLEPEQSFQALYADELREHATILFD